MLRRCRIFRWPALVATVLLATAWLLSRYGSLWVAAPVGGRMAILVLMSGVVEARLDPMPPLPSAIRPAAGFSVNGPMPLLIYH